MTRLALRALLAATLGMVLTQAQTPVPMPAGTNTIVGRITEVGTGTPVGGAIVTLAGHFDAAGRSTTPEQLAIGRELPPSVSVMTTSDGYFVVRNLPAGRFAATIRAFGYVNSDFPRRLSTSRIVPGPPTSHSVSGNTRRSAGGFSMNAASRSPVSP